MKNSTIVVLVSIVTIALTVLLNTLVTNYSQSFNQDCYEAGSVGFEVCHNGEKSTTTFINDEGVRESTLTSTTSLVDDKAEVDAEVARILNEIEHAPAYQANNCITAVHVERHIVYVSFAPCHGEGGVGVIYNIDAKFWSAEVAAQFSK